MRRILVFLDRESYQKLADLARTEERAVDQQAAFLLRQLLRGRMSCPPPPPGAAEPRGC
jgi:hypothetical protein